MYSSRENDSLCHSWSGLNHPEDSNYHHPEIQTIPNTITIDVNPAKSQSQFGIIKESRHKTHFEFGHKRDLQIAVKSQQSIQGP